MLVISRKREERVLVKIGGQKCWITVCDLRGDKVRMGFDAPREVIIHREEVVRVIEEDEKNGNGHAGG